MIKVLIVSIGNMAGGIENYTLTLGQLLNDKEFETHYALRQGGWLSKQISSDNVIRLDMRKKHLYSSMFSIKKYAEDKNINIIHCNSNNALFVCQLIKENDYRKIIGVIHGDVIVDQAHKGKIATFLYKQLETWLVKKKCSCCIAVSESMKSVLISRGVDKEKIKVIYNGVVQRDYDKLPDYNEEMITICTVGSLLPGKNQIKILAAFGCLKKLYPEVKFCCDIYGEGPERENLEEYIRIHGLSEVCLKGFDADVRGKLNRYTLYIHPSVYESFGIAIVEAMNAACCVIANAAGGMLEIINNDTGFFVDAQDEKKIAAMFYHCYCHREEVKEKALAGQECVKRSFSTLKMRNEVGQLYRKLLRVQSEDYQNKDKL